MKRIGRYAVIWVPPMVLLAAFLFRAEVFAAAAAVGRYMFCPMYAFTGILCPGCGGTRAALALLQGKVWLSLRCNPTVIGIVVILILWYAEAVMKCMGRPRKLIPRRLGFWIVMIVILLLWTAARNVFPGLQPPISV